MPTQTRRFSLWLICGTILFCTGLDRPAWAGVGVWTPVGFGAFSLRGGGGWTEVASVTVHPGSPGTVWVGMPQGGLYRSSDGGVNWRWAGGPFISSWTPGVSAVAADPSRPGALWAATKTGVFRTPDGGAHWAQLTDASYTDALGEQAPEQLIAVPGALYVMTLKRLLASTDSGRTWEILYEITGDGAIQSFAAHPAAPRVLYLAVSPDTGSPLQSLDGGQTWATLTSCPPEVGQITLAPVAAYISVYGDPSGLLRSTDLGRTWRPVLGGTPGRQFAVHEVAVDPRAPGTLYVSGSFEVDLQDGLWVSHNAGDTWERVGPEVPGPLCIDSAAGILYTYGSFDLHYGVRRSVDGGATWTTVLRAPSRGEAAQITFRPGDPARAALAVGFTLYRSRNGGATWMLSGLPWAASDVDLDPADPKRLIVVNKWSAYLSEDAGRSWRQTGRNYQYADLLVRADAQTLLAGGAGIYRSGDNGLSWQAVLPRRPEGSHIGQWTQKIEVDPAHPSTLYALTFLIDDIDIEIPHGPLSDYGGPSILWRSTDSGRTWKKMTQNLRTFAVDPATSRLYGVRDRQILASYDGGKTWRQAGRAPNGAFDLVIDPTNPDIFYTAPTLWRSRDRGVTWKLVNDRWSPAALTIDPRDSRILYGADSYGVSTITVPD